ncbi:hypothetical protein L1887_39170 [Cichorium endivia]|nr:hypothetical protein L1887_39170 [Cichorium endivia]
MSSVHASSPAVEPTPSWTLMTLAEPFNPRRVPFLSRSLLSRSFSFSVHVCAAAASSRSLEGRCKVLVCVLAIEKKEED